MLKSHAHSTTHTKKSEDARLHSIAGEIGGSNFAACPLIRIERDRKEKAQGHRLKIPSLHSHVNANALCNN